MILIEKKAVPLRHEQKHIINLADDIELCHRLSCLFPRDTYADKRGVYQVNSLYFDTPYDKALRQKADGLDNREKFRIRYYNDDVTYIRLEKKIKSHGLSGKISTTISREQVRKLLQNDIDFLLKSGNPLFIELYSKMTGQQLRPKTIVSYEREAFLYAPGNVRITIDRHLYTGHESRNFFTPALIQAGLETGLSILEVKYDAFLPEIVRMAVQLRGRQTQNCSKYALCRQLD